MKRNSDSMTHLDTLRGPDQRQKQLISDTQLVHYLLHLDRLRGPDQRQKQLISDTQVFHYLLHRLLQRMISTMMTTTTTPPAVAPAIMPTVESHSSSPEFRGRGSENQTEDELISSINKMLQYQYFNCTFYPLHMSKHRDLQSGLNQT